MQTAAFKQENRAHTHKAHGPGSWNVCGGSFRQKTSNTPVRGTWLNKFVIMFETSGKCGTHSTYTKQSRESSPGEALNGRRGKTKLIRNMRVHPPKFDQYGGKTTFARELEEAAAEEPPEVEELSRPWSSAPPHPTTIIRLTVLGLYRVKSGRKNQAIRTPPKGESLRLPRSDSSQKFREIMEPLLLKFESFVASKSGPVKNRFSRPSKC